MPVDSSGEGIFAVTRPGENQAPVKQDQDVRAFAAEALQLGPHDAAEASNALTALRFCQGQEQTVMDAAAIHIHPSRP